MPRLICFFALLVGLGTDSWSKPPSPRPPKISQQQQSQTAPVESKTETKQGGTKETPFFVKILDNENNAAIAAEKAKESQESAAQERRLGDETKRLADYTKLIAAFTLALGIATVVLASVAIGQLIMFYKQLFYMKQATVDAGIAARAAELTANSLKAAERARVYVAVKWTGLLEISPELVSPVVHIKIRNHGKTAAPLKQLRAYLDIVSTYPADLREFPGSENELPSGLVIHGDGGEWGIDVTQNMARTEWENVLRASAMLICVGKIVYLDIYEETRETGFCWQYNPTETGNGGTRWEISPYHKLNYQT